MMMTPARSKSVFTVVYSIHIERMTYTLLERINKTLIFLQILLGGAVITNTSPVLIGLFISTLAIFQFVWQLNLKAAEARASHDRWLSIYNRIDHLNDTELSKEIAIASERDSHVLSSLNLAAQKSASLQLNLRYEDLPKMTRFQRVLSWFAGSNITE